MEFSREELQALIDGLMSRIDETNKRVETLEKRIYDDFLAPAQENYAKWEHAEGLNAFREKHHDLLEPLCDLVRKAENDEAFDLYDKLFSDYSAMENKPDEAEYVASVAASITDQLKALSEALGASEVLVKKSSDDNVEITTDTGDTVEVATDEQTTEEPKEQAPIVEDTTDATEDNNDELESAVEDALKKYENRLIYGGK